MYSKKEWVFYSALGLLYALGFRILWLASTQLEMLPNTVSWYLPAGFRLTFYLLTPFRSWPFIYVISRTSYLWLFGQTWSESNPNYVAESVLWYISHLIVVPGLVMLTVWYFRMHYAKPFLQTVQSTVSLLVMSLVVSLCLGLTFLGRTAIDNRAFSENFVDKLFKFLLGDLVGILAILPITLVAWEIVKNYRRTRLIELLKITVSWAGFVCVLVMFAESNVTLDYYIKVLTIFPAVYFSYRYGWFGAAISTFAICLLTYTSALYGAGATTENQFYIISLSLCCQFLGAAVSEQKALNKKVESANEQLQRSVNQVTDLLTTNRKLSRDIVNAQEEERKRLTRELHDDFGQRITEIKLKAAIARRDNTSMDSLLSEIMTKADGLYRSLKASLGSLRPTGIEEVGLVEILKHGELAHIAKVSGHKWSVQLVGVEPNLTGEQTINLYRICQEAVNNAIKHANASSIQIVLTTSTDNIKVTIADDGQGFDVETANEGFGLAGMKERALATGGELMLRSDPNGTAVSVFFAVRKFPTLTPLLIGYNPTALVT